jgi:GNAT superfamily N-acetyltransferase
MRGHSSREIVKTGDKTVTDNFAEQTYLNLFNIRKILLDEYDLWSKIWQKSASPEWISHVYTEIVSGKRLIFVCTLRDQYIGECELLLTHNDPDYTIPSRRIYLAYLTVKPKFRNKGLGKALIDYTVNYARSLGYKEMSVGVNFKNYNARRLYQMTGFDKVIREGQDEYGKYLKLLKKLQM